MKKRWVEHARDERCLQFCQKLKCRKSKCRWQHSKMKRNRKKNMNMIMSPEDRVSLIPRTLVSTNKTTLTMQNTMSEHASL